MSYVFIHYDISPWTYYQLISSRTLMFAATDTTSNALARTLDLLVRHPDVQEKLRAELIETSHAAGGDIPYDQLVDLPFLDAVCRETLRL